MGLDRVKNNNSKFEGMKFVDCMFLILRIDKTHPFLSTTANKLEVSAEPSKSADRELSAESALFEDMNVDS